MKVKEVFFRNIEDDIAPVIYFHQLSPEIAAAEVSEYVFTTRPGSHGNRLGGIHEQMTGLLHAVADAVEKGNKLPASWVSGFFGSGKSSFAKLLGLALGGLVLPDGRRLDEALIERDDTPRFSELREAFDRLKSTVDGMAVLFDIGTAAKNNESVPHTAYREVLKKLGYSAHDGVANYELALEDEGRYEEFCGLYKITYGRPWSDRSSSALAAQQFRAVYKQLYPEQDELLEVSTFGINSLSIQNLVGNIRKALGRRAPGKTVFIVVDEVSQYIIKDDTKMLALQSFVSEIGGDAAPGRSPLWLIVTGQEKLEEESKDSVLFKLKDRFPPELRVHLDRANVREVVSRRLLKKRSGSPLEEMLTDTVMDSLKLHGYECASLNRKDMAEHYPLLPGHIPLFMDITQSIRNRSVRTQSDAGGVRSVLNNIWDLFNRPPVALKDRDLGTLLTIDMLYDIIGSSIDGDVQMTLHRVFEKHEPGSWEARVIKAVALLEMNAEQVPVTAELAASLLYPALGAPSVLDEVSGALAVLEEKNWIYNHEKNGYLIQNNAAQDWKRQKRDMSVSAQRINELLVGMQEELVSTVNLPTLNGVRFPLEVWWGRDQKITAKNEVTRVSICFHWVTNGDLRRDTAAWVNLSREDRERFHWVSGETTSLEQMVREYERSRRMVKKNEEKKEKLSLSQKQLLLQEQVEGERLYESIRKDLRTVWMQGTFYFNGDFTLPNRGGGAFDTALKNEVEGKLKDLYHKFAQGNVNIHESDFKQLLERDVSGLSTVFFKGADSLGIAQNDAGKIVFRCEGQVPLEVFNYIDEQTYRSGEQLIRYFGGPPFGYSSLVIRASVAGLLREERLRVIDSRKNEITSIQDPGARAVFEQQKEFQKAEIEVNRDAAVTGRDRNAIRDFFEKSLGLRHLESDSDILADLVFRHFPELKDRISELSAKLGSLRIAVSSELAEMNRALTESLESRQVQKALERVSRNLDTLKEGAARLKEMEEALNTDTEKELRRLRSMLDNQAGQLEQIDRADGIAEDIRALKDQLESAEPWRGYADVKPGASRIDEAYRQVRTELKTAQQKSLDEQVEQLRLRGDFSTLEVDQQQEVLQRVRRSFVDVDDDAVHPSLLLIKQTPDRIRESASEAHRMVDQMVGEGQDDGSKVRIHTVSAGLRNKIVSTEEELDRLLSGLRGRSVEQLQRGAKVRFEE